MQSSCTRHMANGSCQAAAAAADASAAGGGAAAVAVTAAAAAAAVAAAAALAASASAAVALGGASRPPNAPERTQPPTTASPAGAQLFAVSVALAVSILPTQVLLTLVWAAGATSSVNLHLKR